MGAERTVVKEKRAVKREGKQGFHRRDREYVCIGRQIRKEGAGIHGLILFLLVSVLVYLFAS